MRLTLSTSSQNTSRMAYHPTTSTHTNFELELLPQFSVNRHPFQRISSSIVCFSVTMLTCPRANQPAQYESSTPSDESQPKAVASGDEAVRRRRRSHLKSRNGCNSCKYYKVKVRDSRCSEHEICLCTLGLNTSPVR
jgi:hypothetical protein